jgi:hypothetical protein
MPSATGQNWEKYKKEFADDEVEEKKITPLSDEYVIQLQSFTTTTDLTFSGISTSLKHTAQLHMLQP